MISFDDNSSGGGSNIDLSPIYASIGGIKSNTQSLSSEMDNIWNFVSTLSFTTISYSTPYLETYRTQDEMYMYNITGDLPTFSNSEQYLRGNFNILSKTYNGKILNIDYVLNAQNVNFVNCNMSMTGKIFNSFTFTNCGLIDIKCRELNNVYITTCPEIIITADYFKGLSDSSNSIERITTFRVDGLSSFKYNNLFSVNTCYINSFKSIHDNIFNNITYLSMFNIYDYSKNTLSNIIRIKNNCEQFYYNELHNIIHITQDGYFGNNTCNSVGELSITGACAKNIFNSIDSLRITGNLNSNTFKSVFKINMINGWMISNSIYGSDTTYIDLIGNAINANLFYASKNYLEKFRNVNIVCNNDYSYFTFNNCEYINLTGNGGYIYLSAGNNLGMYNIVGNLSIGSFEKCNLKHYGQYLDKATFKSLYNGFFSDYDFRSNNISTCEHLNLTGYQINSCTFEEITEAKMDVSIASNVNYNIISSLSASIYSAKTATFNWIQSAVLDGAIYSNVKFNDISTLDIRNVKYLIYPIFENITCLRLSELSSDNIIYQSDGIIGVDIMKVENSWWNGTMLNIPSSAGLALHSSYVSIGGVAAMNYTH
jgi:hypothetical protein